MLRNCFPSATKLAIGSWFVISDAIDPRKKSLYDNDSNFSFFKVFTFERTNTDFVRNFEDASQKLCSSFFQLSSEFRFCSQIILSRVF